MFGWLKGRKKDKKGVPKKWKPIVADKHRDVDGLLDQLINWNKDPQSEPMLEEWYKNGYPHDAPYEVVVDRDEIDFNKYYPMYLEAERLERKNKSSEALNIYLQILKKYRPQGTSYYKKAIILLSLSERYDEAMQICDRAVMEIQNKHFNADEVEFVFMKERLRNKEQPL